MAFKLKPAFTGRVTVEAPLRRMDLDPDPVAQFRAWFDAHAPHAMGAVDAIALATADADGRPSARMVLLKGYGADGFRFFTNRESRKGRDLAANPVAALLWYDAYHGRQVRVEGPVRELDDAASDAYWRTRPRGSRLSAAVSAQSRPVVDGHLMILARDGADARFDGVDVPRPSYWGGYALVPDRYEFWQHRENRFHDRFEYVRVDDAWRVERLWP